MDNRLFIVRRKNHYVAYDIKIIKSGAQKPEPCHQPCCECLSFSSSADTSHTLGPLDWLELVSGTPPAWFLGETRNIRVGIWRNNEDTHIPCQSAWFQNLAPAPDGCYIKTKGD